ncbi:MAG: hypothetical protein NVS4B8_13860 [Herpetosiphon sp.]
MAKLLKTPFRGGIVTLTESELIVGEGWLGTRNPRRYAFHALTRIDLAPSPIDQVAGRNMCLRFVWNNGQTVEIDGIGPTAAQRIHTAIHALGWPNATNMQDGKDCLENTSFNVDQHL